MEEPRTCPNCGAELATDAPTAPCPACLMKLGLESWENRDSIGATLDAPDRAANRRFEPPTPAELASRLPQFEIIELLGCGGMGAVYKARQKSLDRLVALKIINPATANEPGFAERFTREAKALAKLNHPNIVAIYDFGSVESLYYLVMEFVDGTNLRHLLESKELTPAQALQIVPQVCEALQFAHDEGVVHRDIKPENILVGLHISKRVGANSVSIKIADFGLAKLLDQATTDEQSLTATHQVMGTPRYMAPEQMEGSSAVDHRADIYSLGVVFYEMLTGELPLGRFAPPSAKVAVDTRLDEVVFRSLEKEPARRYQQASEVHNAVTSIRDSKASEAPLKCVVPSKMNDDDFVLRNPRLPKIAQWICVYAIVFRPAMALLMFLLELTHPAFAATEDIALATSLELMLTVLLAPVDLLFAIMIAMGGLKLRALRPWGPRLIKLTVAVEVVLGGVVMVGVILLLSGIEQLSQVATQIEIATDAGLTPDEVELLSRTDEYPIGAAEVTIGFLGITTIVVDLAMLLWLRANKTRLPLVDQSDLGSVPQLQKRPKNRASDSESRRSVAGPAIGLIVVGLFDLLQLAISVLAIPLVLLALPNNGHELPVSSALPSQVAVICHTPATASAGAFVIGQMAPYPEPGNYGTISRISFLSIALVALTVLSTIPLAGLTILAGMKMRNLELYPLAVIASILVMVPCHVGFLIGFPVGIWSLVVLTKPTIRDAFRAAKSRA